MARSLAGQRDGVSCFMNVALLRNISVTAASDGPFCRPESSDLVRSLRAAQDDNQNLKRAVIWIVRIWPAPITCPNVGEFTVVSIVVSCGRLKMFEAEAR